jgi:hypothetical protein
VSTSLLPSPPLVPLLLQPSSLVSSLVFPPSSEVDNLSRKNPSATMSSSVEVSLASSSEKEKESSS